MVRTRAGATTADPSPAYPSVDSSDVFKRIERAPFATLFRWRKFWKVDLKAANGAAKNSREGNDDAEQQKACDGKVGLVLFHFVLPFFS